jgi:hypothetical protein
LIKETTTKRQVYRFWGWISMKKKHDVRLSLSLSVFLIWCGCLATISWWISSTFSLSVLCLSLFSTDPPTKNQKHLQISTRCRQSHNRVISNEIRFYLHSQTDRIS